MRPGLRRRYNGAKPALGDAHMIRSSIAACAMAAAFLVSTSAAAQPAFLRSAAPLGDPRGYCIDVPGFGDSLDLDAPITTHSCKYDRPGFYVDELVEQTEDGRLRLATYDRCLSAGAMELGAGVDAVDCADERAHGWRITPDGRVTPEGENRICLTLAAERTFANTDVMTAPAYSSRAVTLEPCAEQAAFRQAWRWSAPHEQTTWNANTLADGMPEHIAERIREMGPVIDPPGTAAIYSGEPRRFGPADVEVTREISYGPHERHRLDVYVGANRSAPGAAPVLMLVHGGGFVGGGLGSFVNGATHFAGLGFVVVNITYPLAPENKFPAGPRAVGQAMNWARDNAASYGGDPQRIFVLGASAGATHVAGYVFMPSLLEEGTAEAAGAVLYSPNFVVNLDDPEAAAVYYGEDLEAIPDKLVVPGNIERTSIPVLATLAEYDPPPFHQSVARLYHELVNDHGINMRLRQLPGHNHISVQSSIGTQDRMFVEEVFDFIAATNP